MKALEKRTGFLILDAQTGMVMTFSSNLENLLRQEIRENEKPPFEVLPEKFQFKVESNSGSISFRAQTTELEWRGRKALLVIIEEASAETPKASYPEELADVLQNMLSSLPGFVYLCENDPQWTMLYISPGFKELTGYDPEEVIGNRLLSFNDLIHPDHRQRVWEEWQRVLREGKPYEGEYPIITRNGEIKWVWERGRGVYTEEGKLFLEGFLIDITSLKEAQTRFKEKEEEYRQLSLEFKALLDAIPDNLTLQTPDLKIVWANWGAAASINKEVPELIGKHCYELWHGRSEPCLVCPVQRAFQSGKMEEDIVTTPDGRVWFLSSIPIKDEEGKVRNVVEMGRDITASHRAQEELRESEEKFHILVELSSDGIFLEDQYGNILDCNEAGARIYGYKKEEIIGKNIRDLVPEDFARTLPEVIDFDSGGVYEERRSKRKDGSIFPSEIATRLCTVRGERRLLAYVRDITERKLAEEALRESEERWRTYIEQASDLIFTLDPSRRITSVNRAVCEALGYQAEELLGKSPLELVAPQARESTAEALNKVLNGEGVAQIEVPVLRRDGRLLTLELRGRRLYQEGKLVETLHIARDITERKLAEEALRESEERFRSLFENSTIGLYRSTPDGKILLANSALIQMLGYSTFDELSTRNLEKESFPTPYPRAKFIELIEKEGEIRGYESAWKRRDGSILFIRESARAIRDSNGNTLYYDGTVENITERKLAEEALKESERRYHTLAEISPVGIFQADAHGSTTYVNPKWCEISGLSKEEALGEGWLKAVHPEEREEVRKGWIEATREGRPSRAEYRFLRPDGKISWVIGQAVPQRNEKGEVLGYVGTITEITERKLMERALEEEKTKFEALAQSAPYGMALVSQKGKWLYINPKFTEITGYSIEDVPDGKTWFRKAFPDPLYRKQVVQSWIESVSSTTLMEKRSRIFRVTRKDGAERTFKITAVQIPMGDFLVTFEDITLQREMEEALRKSEEQYRTLVENLSEGVDIVDAEENFVFANPACEKIFGVPPGGLKGRNLKEFTAPGYERKLEEETEKRKKGISGKYEFQILREDGQLRNLEVSAVPRYDEKGNYSATMAIISDVTERKMLEQEAEKARSDLLFSVSHELKTPLFLMATAQEMISMLPEEKRRERFLEYEELWNRNLVRLKMLIDNLVDAQRTEKTGLKLNLQKMEIQPLIEQSIKDLLVLAQRKRVEFLMELDPLPPLNIDPEAILRILHNLISNAIKFSPPESRIDIVLKAKENFAQIIVRDYGVGIEPETIPYLFRPFTRAPEALKAKISGSGLGLYVSKVLVEAHDGKIELQSQPGKGTTVTVFLPLS